MKNANWENLTGFFIYTPVFLPTFSLEILKHDISMLLLVTLLTLNLLRKMRLSYSSVETALASLRVSQETRGHLLSHGVTGVQATNYDGHDYAPQKLEALETLHRLLTETSASVVHIASRVKA